MSSASSNWPFSDYDIVYRENTMTSTPASNALQVFGVLFFRAIAKVV
jgi:hypothetical protein